MRKPNTIEKIIAAAEVLRREERDIHVNRVASQMRTIYEIAHNNGEEPTHVAKCLLTWDVDELF